MKVLEGAKEFCKHINMKASLVVGTLLVPVMAFAEEVETVDLASIKTQVAAVCTPGQAMMIAGACVTVGIGPALAWWGSRKITNSAWKGLTRGKIRI